MPPHRDRNSVLAMLGNLGWPLILGMVASTVFYGAMYQGILDSAFVRRYFAAHPVSFFATGMFFVGLAALLLKLMNVIGQLALMPRIGLDEPKSGLPVERCGPMLDELEDLSAPARQSYLGNRLCEALEYVERKGSAQGLDDELKYLADTDAMRQHDSYSLVRIIIWATPMLGFLGTVIGITKALGDLDPSELATSIQTAMEGLLSGLYIAFDTTALALTLSIILMFFQFFVDRLEGQLLAAVDEKVNDELVGRFQTMGSADDPHLASVQQTVHQAVQATELLVQRQVDLWREAMEKADRKWISLAEQSAEAVRESLTASLSRFADRIAAVDEKSAELTAERWSQWQTVLSQNARMLEAQQKEMLQQTEMMARVAEATGDVIKLESVLNENLNALAGSKNFEDTVMSLAAAIHLLNTRLGAPDEASRHVELGHSGTDRQGRAA